jgi:osmotically-inducible protein OsmY
MQMTALIAAARRVAWTSPVIGLCFILLAACGTENGDQTGDASLLPQTEKSLGQSASDQRIEKELGDLLFQADRKLYQAVEYEVEEGRVLLSGKVRSVQDRLDAVRLAWQIAGVREVINEMEVGDEGSVSDFARDTWITSQVSSKLLFDKEVRSLDYSVETVDQVVYIMGVAQSQAALDRVVAHAKNVEYVRRVVSYVRLKDATAEGS